MVLQTMRDYSGIIVAAVDLLGQYSRFDKKA